MVRCAWIRCIAKDSYVMGVVGRHGHGATLHFFLRENVILCLLAMRSPMPCLRKPFRSP